MAHWRTISYSITVTMISRLMLNLRGTTSQATIQGMTMETNLEPKRYETTMRSGTDVSSMSDSVLSHFGVPQELASDEERGRHGW